MAPHPIKPGRDDRWRLATAEAMAAAGLTQWDVADAVAKALRRPGFTQANVQSALCGRTRPPLETLQAWGAALKLTGPALDRWYLLALADHLPPFLVAHLERGRAR